MIKINRLSVKFYRRNTRAKDLKRIYCIFANQKQVINQKTINDL